MAQWTGTEILASARIIAQDNDASSNFGVGAANALALLNRVLMRMSAHINVKAKYLAASTTGLSFSAGDVYKETSVGSDYADFESFHPSNVNTLTFPVAPALKPVTVSKIQEMLDYDGDNALAQAANEWTHVAVERTQDLSANKWRVWAYPVINRTRYMVAKALPNIQIALIGDTPDITESEARIAAELLAWEIARVNRKPQDFVDSILSTVPRTYLSADYHGAALSAQLQDRVEWREW